MMDRGMELEGTNMNTEEELSKRVEVEGKDTDMEEEELLKRPKVELDTYMEEQLSKRSEVEEEDMDMKDTYMKMDGNDTLKEDQGVERVSGASWGDGPTSERWWSKEESTNSLKALPGGRGVLRRSRKACISGLQPAMVEESGREEK
jgi:hypothetical protein